MFKLTSIMLVSCSLLSLLTCRKDSPDVAVPVTPFISVQGGDCTTPCSVTFVPTIDRNQQTTGLTYRWNFGDYPTSTDSVPIPVHDYQRPGTYLVSLTVTSGPTVSTLTTQVITGNGVQWDITLGGNESDRLITTLRTPDGGYLLAGYSDSNASNDKTDNSRGFDDYWIVKLSGEGKKLWDKTYGGNNTESLMSVSPTTNGDYLVAGRSFSKETGDRTVPPLWTEKDRIKYDTWLVEVEQNGPKTGEVVISNQQQFTETVLITSDGGFLAGGSTHDFSELNGAYANSAYTLRKFNAQGQQQWQKVYGGDGYENYCGILPAHDGGYILYGSSTSDRSGDKSEPSRGKSDFWLVKIGPDGIKEWDKTLGGGGSDYATTMHRTPDGGYLIGGNSASGQSGDKSEKGFSWEVIQDYIRADYWVVKLDGRGQKQWDRTFGGNDVDYLRSIVVLNDGNYLLAGTSKSGAYYNRSAPKVSTGTDSDYWLVKITPSGAKLWDKAIGGNDDDELAVAFANADGSITLAGTATSNVGFDKSAPSRGKSDFWIVNLKR